jgi:hypothetical protein
VFGAVMALAAAPGEQATTPAPACSKVWLGHESELQDYLRTARIERIEEVPIGVTKPKRAYFESGGSIASAAWKPLPPGRRKGFMESYKAEIAAYEMDRLLGLGMVPPYVERRIDGDLGALSLWVENIKGWDAKSPVKGPDSVAWTREVLRMKMFDALIGNIDRNQGNLLYDGEYHLILIDHSRAFTTVTDLSKMAAVTRVDRELWERMRALDEPQLKAALRQWVNDKELRAILARRDRMEAELSKLAAQRGEAAVYVR